MFLTRTASDADQGFKIGAGRRATTFCKNVLLTRFVPRLPAMAHGPATMVLESVYGKAVISFVGGCTVPGLTRRFADDKTQAYIMDVAESMRAEAFADVFVEVSELVGRELADYFEREAKADARERERTGARVTLDEEQEQEQEQTREGRQSKKR
jgi:hypothetical protein